ncbi:hypothetical protein [Streptosporangium roseum]|uniref:hypothetical protein n=1 Tax=Streptosporangium roseum TaxID=2001 RepID=UPI0004CDACFE|nr:hypothetical protein [Streptosporangium roseum]
MSGITFPREAAGTTVYIAPPGTHPDDAANWQAIGTTSAPIVLILDDPPPRPVGAAYAVAVANRAALTWRGQWLLLGRTHPHARRTKSTYHQRRR